MANSFKANTKGFIELRNSAAMQALLREKAQAVKESALHLAPFGEPEFNVEVYRGTTRARARVESANRAAYWANFNGHNTLVAALDAGRG